MRKASAWSNRTFDLTLWFRASGAFLLDVKRFGDQARLLAFVGGKRTDCGTGAGTAARIGDVATEKLPYSWFDETPGAHVLRFFLTPNKLGSLWIWLDVGAQLFFSERVKLFNPNDGGVADLLRFAIIQ